MLGTITNTYRSYGSNYKKKEVIKMKTTVKIYDRMDNDVPYNSSIYIINTGIGYVVITNLFGYTFREKFNTKEEALDYYINYKKEGFYYE